MASPWRPPFKDYGKRNREESLSPEAQSSASKRRNEELETYAAVQVFREKLAELLSKFERMDKRLKVIENEFRAKEDPTPKLEEIRNAIIEIREEDLPGITKELEETNTKIDTMEKKTKEELQAYLDEEIKKAVEEITTNTKTTESTSNDPAETGLFITGLKKLREIVKSGEEEDPCDVVHTVLQNVGASSYYTKIVAVFPANQRRREADKAIVYFTSVYHRRWTSGQLRLMLAKQGLKEISIRDVFPRSSLESSRLLTKVGFHLRRAQAIDRFRVVNDKNTPKLLVSKGRERYSEISGELLETSINALNGEDV